MIEIVIDGTNFGGKTPLVARLIEALRAQGLSVETASPYREVEVYSLWDDRPAEAAGVICATIEAHRQRAAGADVFVWDRGWPTCFIATRDPAARRLFLPLPPLTFVLLNTAAATEKKVKKYGISEHAYPWMHRRRLRDESTYDDLCRRFADDLRVFRPTLDDDRFDLDLVAAEILAEAAAALADPPAGAAGP